MEIFNHISWHMISNWIFPANSINRQDFTQSEQNNQER